MRALSRNHNRTVQASEPHTDADDDNEPELQIFGKVKDRTWGDLHQKALVAWNQKLSKMIHQKNANMSTESFDHCGITKTRFSESRFGSRPPRPVCSNST